MTNDPSVANMSEDAVLKQAESLLISSIEHRLVSDVEVASFLSGGIDSSLVSAIYQKCSSKQINTFSIGFDTHKRYDETEFAQRLADDIGANHTRIEVTKNDFLSQLDRVIHALDEPINDPACTPTNILSGFVADQGIKVALTGEGSDELFFGYDHYFTIFDFYSLQRANGIFARDYMSSYIDDSKSLRREWEFMKRVVKGEEIYRTIGENFTDHQKVELFPSMNLHGHNSIDHFEKYMHNYKKSNRDSSTWCSYIDFRHWISEVLMMKLDKNAMDHSLELRAPFLDYRLVDFMFSVDPEMKKGNTNKSLLKKISRNHIPDYITDRQKKGFSSPFIEWLYEAYGSQILTDLKSINDYVPIFDEAFMEKLYEEAKHGRFKIHVWGLWMLSQWLKKEY